MQHHEIVKALQDLRRREGVTDVKLSYRTDLKEHLGASTTEDLRNRLIKLIERASGERERVVLMMCYFSGDSDLPTSAASSGSNTASTLKVRMEAFAKLNHVGFETVRVWSREANKNLAVRVHAGWISDADFERDRMKKEAEYELDRMEKETERILNEAGRALDGSF